VPLLVPPNYEERVLFLGENGSGKTYLATAFLASGFCFVAVDHKGDLRIPGATLVRNPDDKRLYNGRVAQILYRPDPEYATGPGINYVLKGLFFRGRSQGKRRPFVVYVDEALVLSAGGHVAYLRSLAVAGRSMGVGLWCASQRPAWIPREVRSEAWRIYVFSLGSEDDEKEVLKYTKRQLSLDDLEQATTNHAFIEIRRTPHMAGGRTVTRFPPVSLDIGEEEAEDAS